MLKKALLILVLLPNLLLAYDINFSKSFSKTVTLDQISSYVSISVEKSDEKAVNKEIEYFNNFLSNKDDLTIKNINYYLMPKYEYIKDKSIFKGYNATLSFTTLANSGEKLNEFFTKLLDLKAKKPDVKINISNLSWEISSKLQTKIEDELKLEAINWIESYSKDLSAKIVRKCEIKNVNIYDNVGYVSAKSRVMEASMDNLSSNISPISSQENMSINANFVLDCR